MEKIISETEALSLHHSKSDCCEFRPANGCSARCVQVKIDFQKAFFCISCKKTQKNPREIDLKLTENTVKGGVPAFRCYS